VKKKVIALIFIFLFTLGSVSARAGLLIDLTYTGYTEETSNGKTRHTQKQAYLGGVGVDVFETLWVGLFYTGMDHTVTGKDKYQVTLTDLGPFVRWQWKEGGALSFAAGYGLLAKASIIDDTSKEEWEGTAYWGQVAFTPEVFRGFHLGVAGTYYSAYYTTRKIESTEKSASYTINWFLPTVTALITF